MPVDFTHANTSHVIGTNIPTTSYYNLCINDCTFNFLKWTYICLEILRFCIGMNEPRWYKRRLGGRERSSEVRHSHPTTSWGPPIRNEGGNNGDREIWILNSTQRFDVFCFCNWSLNAWISSKPSQSMGTPLTLDPPEERRFCHDTEALQTNYLASKGLISDYVIKLPGDNHSILNFRQNKTNPILH